MKKCHTKIYFVNVVFLYSLRRIWILISKKEQKGCKGTCNRVQEGRQGTVEVAGNTEQSKGTIKRNRKGAREHVTESSKVAREQWRLQGTLSRVKEGFYGCKSSNVTFFIACLMRNFLNFASSYLIFSSIIQCCNSYFSSASSLFSLSF